MSSNQHGSINSKEISQKKTTRKVWVPKPIIEDILSKSSKINEKPMAIWIPKSFLRDSNVELQLILTLKLLKTFTSSSFKRILLFHMPKPQPLLSIHPILSCISSFIFSPSSCHPSWCVMLIFPFFFSTLSQFFHSLSFYLLSFFLIFLFLLSFNLTHFA